MREDVRAALGSDSRELFLLALGHRLAVAARGAFTEAGAVVVERARACNEMMICVWSQAWATRTGAAGYPDADFLSVLLEKADVADARPFLRDALESALLAVRTAEREDRPDDTSD
ncbi:hypothetical protein ACFWBF_28635 [Streptomyces sp. NPDC060028]|uniref:hypothetical protein n=1 Tax=Streptomyces sp. NPDC060028 TaxID=3347041 RepID=UPI0036A10CF5